MRVKLAFLFARVQSQIGVLLLLVFLRALCLGPFSLCFFVNDINDVVSSPLFQFADDHTVLRPILSERDHVALQNDIHNIFQWTLRNKLPLNLSKCSVIHMTRSKSPNYCDTYIVGDGTLVEVDEFKLLGVTFSKDLSFDSQLMLFLTRFQNRLVLSRGAQEACPLMLCLTSIRPLSCHILSIVLVFGPLIKGIIWIG